MAQVTYPILDKLLTISSQSQTVSGMLLEFAMRSFDFLFFCIHGSPRDRVTVRVNEICYHDN